ncbi:Ribosomal RNA small subunit methyltransferase F [uncultured archaeon]|nr:Ribosomal RNA small subunit methyltransferase F [uncultured archaeon]
MKDNYGFVPSRELKEFCRKVKSQYGEVPELFDELAFVQGKEKFYVIGRDLDKVELKNLHINSIGLYVAEVKGGQLRLSIEGAQLVGPSATKNVCEITEEQLKQWFKGQDLKVEGAYSGFVILKCGSDYVGSGKFKEGLVLNFVPKARRLSEVH